MSPSIHFPSPFGGRDLPPYGAADWKRIQPALLRRSLALSSMAALLAGLLLGWVLQHADLPPPKPPVIIESSHTVDRPPPLPRVSEVRNGNPAARQDGLPVPAAPDTPPVDEPTPPSDPNPLPIDPHLPVGMGGDPKGVVDSFPERPNPKDTVVLDELPFPVYSPKPEYPEIARQAGIEGTVLLQVLVNREGKVVEVLKLAPSPIFDESAERTIRTWRFRPALVGNRPVPAWVTVPVRFVMR